ncbi:unnamed protein product, partial [Adineta steineri]
RTIKAHSHFVTEDEILLLSGTHMVAQSQLSPADNLYIIHLKQVVPKTTLLEPPFEGAHIYPEIKRPFYRKKRFIIPFFSLLALFIAGVIVAIVVGLSNNTPYVCSDPFQQQGSFVTGRNPSATVLDHFRNAIDFDIAVANLADSTVTMLLRNKDYVFQTTSGITGTQPVSIVSEDFNNDGKLDIVTANSDDDTITILVGIGNGLFQDPVNYTVGSGPSYLIAADFNNDKKMDLAVSNQNNNSISVLLGNGNATFQTQ